jgi:hypothetical protein
MRADPTDLPRRSLRQRLLRGEVACTERVDPDGILEEREPEELFMMDTEPVGPEEAPPVDASDAPSTR